ncbi:MAG: LPS assembly protein LptD [Planctomycetota bacterium]
MILSLAFCSLLHFFPAQNPPAKPARQRDISAGLETGSLTYDLAYSRVEGDEYIYILRNPEIRSGDVVASAERGILFLDGEEYKKLIQRSGDPLKPGLNIPDPRERDLLAEAKRRAQETAIAKGPALDLREAPFQGALRAFYLEGDVRIRSGTDRSSTADGLFLDTTTGRLLMMDGAVRFDLETGGRPLSLAVRAKLIRQEITGVASFSDAHLTSCEFAVPHYHIRAQDLSLTWVSRNELLIDSSDSAIIFGDAATLPLPDTSIFSSDLRYLPLEAISAGHSRRDGAFLRTRWGRDFKDIGNDLNQSLGVTGEFKGHWSIDLDMLTRRGPGLGGTLEYETPGSYRGRTTGYLLSDHGENRGFLSEVYEEHESTRGRFHTENRIMTGDQSWLDVEFSPTTDPLFRPEFYSTEFKREKEHENIIYYRTAGETLSFTGLAKTNIRSFEPIVETGVPSGAPSPSQTNAYPFLDGRFHPAPILNLPIPAGLFGAAADRDLELYYKARADAGYLERHYSEGNISPAFPGPPPIDPLDQRSLRFDTAHELSIPFSLGFGKLVPYVEARETFADRSVPVPTRPFGLGESDESVSRRLLTAGIRFGTHLERDFGSVRHLIDFRADYRNQFDSSEDAARFIQFDEIDTLDQLSRVDFDIRNRISLKDPVSGARWTFADVRVLVPYYPRSNRDNAGDRVGDVRTDARLDFGSRFVIPDLRIRSRTRIDNEDENTRKSDSTIIVSPFGPEVDLSLSYRESHSDYRAVAFGVSSRIGRKWDLDIIEQFDFVQNRAIQQRVAMRRYGHDFAIEFSFTFDTNDNSQSVAIAILPLLGGSDRPSDRFFVPEPLLRGFY